MSVMVRALYPWTALRKVVAGCSPRLLCLLWAVSLSGCAAAAATPSSVQQPARYDVIVRGSTPAAVAAAISAARRGMRVALVSRHTVLGGDLTLGMLTQWDVKPDPQTGKLPGGIFKEFYDALPSGFEPAYAAEYFRNRILSQSGITWLAGAHDFKVDVQPGTNGERISSLSFSVRGGERMVASAAYYIDATEDGDLAAAAGAHYDVGRQDTGVDTLMQPVTLMFSLGGVEWPRVAATYDKLRFGSGGVAETEAWGYSRLMREYPVLSARVLVRDANFQLERDGTVLVNAIDVMGTDGRQDPALEQARTIAEDESRHFVTFLQSSLPGFEHARIVHFAPQLYVRETRHIRGLMTIDAAYIWDGERTYDTIAYAAYPLDVHPVARDERGGDGWATAAHRYGVPLRALVVNGFQNLAIAGPAISATHTASGSLRVLPTTIAEGEALGAACALSVRSGEDLPRLAASQAQVGTLQRELGVVSGEPQLGSARDSVLRLQHRRGTRLRSV